MNVRIDEKSVRFRIAPDELKALLRGDSVSHFLKVGAGQLSYSVLPVRDGAMTLQVMQSALILSAPLADIERLQNLGRSKEGLVVQQDELNVSLQVDLKMQKRDAA
jgi:hypothetical protein